MGIRDHFFKWFSSKDKDGKELSIGAVLDGEAKNVGDLKKLFSAFDLESKYDSFGPLIRQKIDLELTPSSDNELKLGQSKFGGAPDLPSDTDWPQTNAGKSMSFIGQINCDGIAEANIESELPTSGLISFFYCADQEAWGFDPKDADRFKVLYTENINELNRKDTPKDLQEHSIFKPNKLDFDTSLSVPGWEHDSIDGLLSDDDIDGYIDLSSGTENQMFGYADCIQGPMELECQLVTNGLYCGDPTGYEDPKRKEIEAGKEDWVLLLQVDSNEDNSGMMWGDLGKLYFWIRKQDLAAKDFDKSWFCLQCS